VKSSIAPTATTPTRLQQMLRKNLAGPDRTRARQKQAFELILKVDISQQNFDVG
jgi:capsule polysaccharide export protein KpsC/LpsZ